MSKLCHKCNNLVENDHDCDPVCATIGYDAGSADRQFQAKFMMYDHKSKIYKDYFKGEEKNV